MIKTRRTVAALRAARDAGMESARMASAASTARRGALFLRTRCATASSRASRPRPRRDSRPTARTRLPRSTLNPEANDPPTTTTPPLPPHATGREPARARARPPVRRVRAAGKRDGRGSETWKDGRLRDVRRHRQGGHPHRQGPPQDPRRRAIPVHERRPRPQRRPARRHRRSQRQRQVHLLSVLAGKDVGREDGELWIRKGVSVAFLEQEPPSTPNSTS